MIPSRHPNPLYPRTQIEGSVAIFAALCADSASSADSCAALAKAGCLPALVALIEGFPVERSGASAASVVRSMVRVTLTKERGGGLLSRHQKASDLSKLADAFTNQSSGSCAGGE